MKFFKFLLVSLIAGTGGIILKKQEKMTHSQQQNLLNSLDSQISTFQSDLQHTKTLLAQGKKYEAKREAVKANDDINEIVDGVMKNMDRPENGAWKRNVLGRIRGITTWHKQIDGLIDELGIHITGDPNNAKKLDAISQL